MFTSACQKTPMSSCWDPVHPMGRSGSGKHSVQTGKRLPVLIRGSYVTISILGKITRAYRSKHSSRPPSWQGRGELTDYRLGAVQFNLRQLALAISLQRVKPSPSAFLAATVGTRAFCRCCETSLAACKNPPLTTGESALLNSRPYCLVCGLRLEKTQI